MHTRMGKMAYCCPNAGACLDDLIKRQNQAAGQAKGYVSAYAPVSLKEEAQGTSDSPPSSAYHQCAPN